MTKREVHALHQGELEVQQRRDTPRDLAQQIPSYIETEMPAQHAVFYSELPYLPLATLDSRGRPWVSLFVTHSKDDPAIGIQVPGPNALNVNGESNPHDPFVHALQGLDVQQSEEDVLFAGVGIDFSNRRRNKLAGSIDSMAIDHHGKLRLALSSRQHLGNCPKYITVRSLEYRRRESEAAFQHFDELNVKFPEYCKDLIAQASTAFIATKHTAQEAHAHSDMGLNHRGGAPGFVRVYEEAVENETSTYIVMPDYSGNRFYQSLGNIQTNRQVGLVFPDFTTGDLLYVTGDAQNLFDKDAEELMPRVSLLTRIRITGAVYVKRGLNLNLISDEQLSPYNPPVRYLQQELANTGRMEGPELDGINSISATMASATQLTSTVSTFSFQLSESITAPAPGGFGVFDFSGVLDAGYRHMDDVNPQLVNEDYVRTWTLSSSPELDVETKRFKPINQVNITVKRKPGGLVSNFLHYLADSGKASLSESAKVKFRGTGKGFSCFSYDKTTDAVSIPRHMLWIAGGVGITPFMSMWEGILKLAHATSDAAERVSSDIVMLYAGRDEDIALLKPFVEVLSSLPQSIRLEIYAFRSAQKSNSAAIAQSNNLIQRSTQPLLHVRERRLQSADFEVVDRLDRREVFLCGPDSLMEVANGSLRDLGGDDLKIHQESYFF